MTKKKNKTYRVSQTLIPAISVAVLISEFTYADINVNFTIEPEQQQHEISPLIYGTNQNMPTSGNENFGFFRFGGNRTSAYNWEINWSSAGSDWQHSSDSYLIPEGADQTEAGVVYTHFLENEVQSGRKSLLTLQMAGYVAADGNGTVTEEETAPSARWIPVYPRKNAPFTTTPDVNDNAVYMDELVNFMVQRYGRADAGGVAAWSLDNEPSLWSHTHSRVHPNPLGVEELITRSVDMASAVKDVDDSALIFGPAFYGYGAYKNLSGAEEWSNYQGQYNWYIDYYLDEMKQASDARGERLMDVLDIHWYSEARGDQRVTDSDALSTADQIARLQAPRTLWDEDYLEDSWIAQWNSSDLPLIPHVKNSIDTYNSGTKLAFTEYSFGGGDHITGGLAQADTLGIFGVQDVYAANSWILGQYTYINAAYRLYRNYDGNSSTFGDISVSASMTDKETSSVYASVDSATDDLHIIVLNKSLTDTLHGSFQINTTGAYGNAQVYAMTANSTEIQSLGEWQVSNNSFEYNLPAISAYHLVLPKTSDNGGGDNGGGDNGGGDNGGGDTSGDVSGVVNITNDWNSGYCASITVTNNTDTAVEWSVDVTVEGTVGQLWNGNWTQTGNTLSVSGVSWNSTLQPGASINSVGFCASR